MTLYPSLLLLSLSLLASGPIALGDTKKSQSPVQVPPLELMPEVTPELESRIVSLFTEHHCDQIVKMVPVRMAARLRPLVIGVVAYCQTDLAVGNPLFEQAEARAPTNEILRLLHARFVWKIDPRAADPLWRNLLVVARSRILQELAREYLSGTMEPGEELEETNVLSLARELSVYTSLQAGGSYESNPGTSPPSAGKPAGSPALNVLAALGAHRDFGFGSLSANYGLTLNNYSKVPSANFLEQDLDLPLAFRAGPTEDVQLRPFLSYLMYGNSPYQILGGFSLVGVAYRSWYKQSVQGSVFWDKYYLSDLVPQQGQHFRFDYNWEIFPTDWFLRFVAYVEHVTAASDTDATGTLSITYSHNDLGLLFFLQYDLKWIQLGFFPRFVLREDDNDSSYLDANQNQATKRRQDLQVSLQPNITIPLETGLQLYIWYEWTRYFSNLGPTDYLDRNYSNSVAGIALRVFLSNL